MKTKFGAIIVDGRGKLGGHVASKNRAGSYLRTKVTPINPNSSFQAAVRNRLSQLSSAWSALTPAQRLLWNGAVASFRRTDIFGDIKNPTGFNLFQKLNNNLSRISVAQINTPPLPTELPSITTGVLAATTAGVMTITFTADPVVSASKIEVEATPAMSPGISFVKSEFRIIGVMPAIAVNVANIAALYIAKFGAVGAVGQKIFVRLKQISNVSGQAGIPVIYSDIIG